MAFPQTPNARPQFPVPVTAFPLVYQRGYFAKGFRESAGPIGGTPDFGAIECGRFDGTGDGSADSGH